MGEAYMVAATRPAGGREDGRLLGGRATKLIATRLHAAKPRAERYGLQIMCEGGDLPNVTTVERL